MEILVAKSAGFCFGVEKAIESVYKEIETGKKPIYTLLVKYWIWMQKQVAITYKSPGAQDIWQEVVYIK